MKLQHLAIIFIIIILPISLIVGEYIQMQINTISMQTMYSSKLQTATYDSMKAFRLNTVNNKYSSVSDSKVRDIEASVSTYFSSLGNEILVLGQGREEIEQFTPALLYTLYDGYYIYSKYYNETDKEYQYGLKPYIYYSCRYKKGNTDITINYTLDNYITIYGTVKGNNYITKSGNIIDPTLVTEIEWEGSKLKSLKYGSENNKVEINREVLSEQIIYLDSTNKPQRETYNYIIYNHNKVYYDGTNYFTINSNFKKQYVNDQEMLKDLKSMTKDGKLYSDSALNYYYEAYLFSEWARLNLGDISQEDAKDENGNKITDFTTDTGDKSIFEFTGNLDITDSCFDLNRISVIRRSIKTNLMTAIANYNNLSQSGYEYVLPVFNEEDWYKLTNNISITSFLQGIPLGTKYFNDYCVITNNINKEVVTLDSLLAITEDNEGYREVHLPNCKKILDNNVQVDQVYKNIDFERQSVVISEGNEVYYYPHYDNKCYNCLVNVAEKYDIDYLFGTVKEYDKTTENYINKSVNSEKLNKLRKEVLQAYGRESYDLYKVNDYFKGYDETISVESISNTETANLETKTKWNEDGDHRATLEIKKKAGVYDEYKIQYIINATNEQVSTDTEWKDYTGPIKGLWTGWDYGPDKVSIRLFDGVYNGDQMTITIKDDIAPSDGTIAIEGTTKDKKDEYGTKYWTSPEIKAIITPGTDNQSGVSKLTYSIEPIKSDIIGVTDKEILLSGEDIPIYNDGEYRIIATTYDYANPSNTSESSIIVKKDSKAPNQPKIHISEPNGKNGYYKNSVKVTFEYGTDVGDYASGIDFLHYEIVTETEQGKKTIEGRATTNGCTIPITTQGGIVVKAYMEDKAGNQSTEVVEEINMDGTPPGITSGLTATNITTNSFRLNLGVKDAVAGIDKIEWKYKRSNESTYKTITTTYPEGTKQIQAYGDITGLVSGVYNTYAIVYDKAGNTYETGTLNVTTLNIDKAEGAIATPNTWTNGNVTVTLPTKEGYVTEYQIVQNISQFNINGTWTRYNGPIVVDKNVIVYYRYSDGVNKGEYDIPLTISNIDKLAPGATTVTYISGSNTHSWKNNYDITLSATDANSTKDYGKSGIKYFEVDWNADNIVDTTTVSKYIPWDGYNSCNTRFRAVDNAGNRGVWSEGHDIHMDTSAPENVTVTYLGGANSCSWKNNYKIELSTIDNVGVAYYEIDTNGDGTADRTTQSTFVPENGYNSCNTKFRAVDNAGNRSNWTEAHHIHMDTEKPTHTYWRWGEVTKDVARLYIQTTDNVGISKVQCPTSTESGKYTNWNWFNAVWDASANAYRCDITPATFEHYGETYKTHLYIYDKAGNGGYYDETSVDIPQIQTSLVVYQADKEGNVSINNTSYVTVPGHKFGASIWYRFGTVTETASILINYKSYTKAEIEFTIVPNNPDQFWEGDRKADFLVNGEYIYSSTDWKKHEVRNYTYQGNNTTINLKASATNGQGSHTGTWVGVDVYITKITLSM